MSQVMQAISVRRRLDPLKQSLKLDPISEAFSISLVWCIMATCFLAKSASTPVTSLLTARSASSNRPFLVSHQGDSGAMMIPMSWNGVSDKVSHSGVSRGMERYWVATRCVGTSPPSSFDSS